MIEAIRDRDCYMKLFNATVEDYDEIGISYKAELATLRAELEQRSPAPLAIEAECVQLRS